MQPTIRAYRPSDLDAVYDICVRTADSGGDGRGMQSTDTLVGDVYAAPYVVLEPEHAHILDAGDGRAIGYIIGTANTELFVRRFREEWLPKVTERYQDDTDPRDESLLHRLRNPEVMLDPALADFPAHLHIDLLPEAQGRGFGRAMMTTFLAGLRAAGVPKVHLGFSPTNTGARAFYARLGFTPIDVPGSAPGTVVGRTTE